MREHSPASHTLEPCLRVSLPCGRSALPSHSLLPATCCPPAYLLASPTHTPISLTVRIPCATPSATHTCTGPSVASRWSPHLTPRGASPTSTSASSTPRIRARAAPSTASLSSLSGASLWGCARLHHIRRVSERRWPFVSFGTRTSSTRFVGKLLTSPAAYTAVAPSLPALTCYSPSHAPLQVLLSRLIDRDVFLPDGSDDEWTSTHTNELRLVGRPGPIEHGPGGVVWLSADRPVRAPRRLT